jgi:hypothetical protein
MRKPRELCTGLFLGLLLYLVVRLNDHLGSYPPGEFSKECAPIAKATRQITAPGSYCLHRDIFTKGIEIRASDVSLDLGGFCLIGPRDPKRTDDGIYISGDSVRVTVSNGCIRGFFYGLRIDEDSHGGRASHIAVREVNFEKNTFRGAAIQADDVDFRNNTVMDTGGATVYDEAYAIGLELSGDRCTVYSNFIGETYGRDVGEGVGISLSSADANQCRVTNNVISNRNTSVFGRTFGIWSDNLSVIEQNTVQGFDYAIVQPPESGDGIRENNVLIDERCHGLFYANDERSLHDIRVPREALRPCADLKEAIAALKSVNRRVYFYRKAERLVTKKKWQKATAYFLAAEELGSTEAARIARKHLSLGLISEPEFETAEQRAKQLLAER